MKPKTGWRQYPQPKKISEDVSISWDAETDPDDLRQWHATLTTGHGDDHQHWDFTRDEAKALHKWLGKFLAKTKPKE